MGSDAAWIDVIDPPDDGLGALRDVAIRMGIDASWLPRPRAPYLEVEAGVIAGLIPVLQGDRIVPLQIVGTDDRVVTSHDGRSPSATTSVSGWLDRARRRRRSCCCSWKRPSRPSGDA